MPVPLQLSGPLQLRALLAADSEGIALPLKAVRAIWQWLTSSLSNDSWRIDGIAKIPDEQPHPGCPSNLVSLDAGRDSATVDRGQGRLTVAYDGQPDFQPIQGTSAPLQ
jgi:hypothetical protein